MEQMTMPYSIVTIAESIVDAEMEKIADEQGDTMVIDRPWHAISVDPAVIEFERRYDWNDYQGREGFRQLARIAWHNWRLGR
jgi:hypothetical protein